MKEYKKHIILLLVVGVSIFLVNLDAIIINIMEARNFITAREMLNDGNWLLTTMNGLPRYEKPPLPTWLTAFSASLFGLKSVFGLRLPAALITLVLLLFNYKLAIKFSKNNHYAFISSLILATSFYIVFSGRNGQWDIFTHGFMMVCIYYLYLFFSSENKKYQRVILAAIFFGMSFMSKGPVSLYALLLPFLISYGIVFKYRNMSSRVAPFLIFILISFLLSGWWYAYTYYFDSQSVAEITQKESNNWSSYNIRPFYYYWSFFTQSGVWTIPAFIGLLYPYLKNKVIYKKAYLFTLLWTLLSVFLLSVIPEKKSRYLLPVLIPLALNTGFYIEYLFRKFSEITNKYETIPVYFNFGLIAIIGLVFPIGGYLFIKDQLSGNWFWFVLLSLVLFTIGFFMFRFLIQKKIKPVFYLTITFIIAIIFFGMPLAKLVVYNPDYKGLYQLNQWQNKTQLEVYEFSGFVPEMVWDYGKPLKMLHKNGKLIIPSEKQFGVLVSKEQLENFKNTFKNYQIKKITRYDMNPNKIGSNSHRPRLWRDLFLVKKE
ncbi:MAG: ArnT family glycosyltransferase [Flavobacteriales bacterium]